MSAPSLTASAKPFRPANPYVPQTAVQKVYSPSEEASPQARGDRTEYKTSNRRNAFPKPSKPTFDARARDREDLASIETDCDARDIENEDDYAPVPNMEDEFGNWNPAAAETWVTPTSLGEFRKERLEDWIACASEPLRNEHEVVQRFGPKYDLADQKIWEGQNNVDDRTYYYSIDKDTSHRCKTLGVELAPRSWFPMDIDGDPTDMWWAEHVKDPAFMDGVPTTQPWWLRYATPVHDYLTPLIHSEAPIDPEDNNMQLVRDQCSEASIASADKKRTPKTKVPTEGMAHEQRRGDVLRNIIGQGPHWNGHSPRLNIYLRPVEKKDIPEILQIYNHYISKTIFSPEMEPISKRTIEQRIKDVDEAKLPWVVAICRSSKNPGRKTQHEVGFSFADEYADITSMYRYTVELELFVDPDFVKYGIGRTLLDKMLHILDTTYITRGGYEFTCDDQTYNENGRRTVACMIIQVPFSNAEDMLSWKTKWLEQFEFEHRGSLIDVGRKLNQCVSQAIFSRPTGLTVRPSAI